MTPLLKQVWYAACLSTELPKSKHKKLKICGEPIVLIRQNDNQIYALRDICPHRGIPLSYGTVENNEIECPYHGWRFGNDGHCRSIPSLTESQQLDFKKIKVRSYPILEQQGVIWLFMGLKDQPPSDMERPIPPILNGISLDSKPNISFTRTLPCHIDHAVIGLMDPAHGPFVHKSIFWRSKKSMVTKSKKFAPLRFGFQMVRHAPSVNSKIYKILGASRSTEISFQIPGVRIEHIKTDSKNVYSLTLLTPISNIETQIIQLLFWDLKLLSLIKPFVRSFAKYFLNQDILAVTQQQEGLIYDPTLMLIRDADTQAKWYFQLKQNWLNHTEKGLPWENHIPETTLSWRS